MLELDGGIYPFVKTTKDNTDDIVDFINNYADEKNITDSNGNKVFIDKNKANTLYMMLFGVGYLATILQKLIRSAADSNSVQNSSAQQLDHIAETMHTSRKDATYSTIECDIVYTLSEIRPSITLDDSTYLSVQMQDGRVLTFVPSYITVLNAYYYNPNNTYEASVQFRCTEAGPVDLSDGIITGFAVPVDGIVSVYNRNCIKGAEPETTEQLRERLQEKQTADTRIDRCSLALEDLTGVSKASVLYNPSISDTFNIINDNSINIDGYHSIYGPFIVPPRQACVFISGISTEISRAFFNHMFCLTTNNSNIGAVFKYQPYTTNAGQNLPFYYTQPISKNISVYIMVLNPVSSEVADNIKQAVSDYIAELSIGQSLSDGEIIKRLYSLYPELQLTGVTFAYDDYYIISYTADDDTELESIMTHLNGTPACVPGYEDSAFGDTTVTLYNNMIVFVKDDDGVENVPYILRYDSTSPGDKWSSDKYYSVHPDMTHKNAHSVTAYPYEQIQVIKNDYREEHITVTVGRAE